MHGVHKTIRIGFDWRQARDLRTRRMLTSGGPAAAAARALRRLLSEGTANAFFTPTDDEWLQAIAPAMTDEDGADFANT